MNNNYQESSIYDPERLKEQERQYLLAHIIQLDAHVKYLQNEVRELHNQVAESRNQHTQSVLWFNNLMEHRDRMIKQLAGEIKASLPGNYSGSQEDLARTGASESDEEQESFQEKQ